MRAADLPHTVSPIAGLAGCALSALCLALPAGAAAETYFAKPGGPTSGECKTEATGCYIEHAVEVKSQPGDTVIVMPGTHIVDAGEAITVSQETVRGTGAEAPVVANTGPAFLMFASGAGTVVERLRMFASQSQPLRASSGATVRSVYAEGRDDGIALVGDGVLLTDSVLIARESGSALSLSAANGPASGTARNVTALGLGPAGNGIAVSATCVPSPCPDFTVALEVKNVVARGNGADLATTAVGTGAIPAISIANSNFRTTSPGAGVTDAGANQTAPEQTASSAVFRDLGSLDLRPPGDSPLIDAGIETPQNGSADVEGNARVQGAAIDIGAYETAPSVEPPTGEDLRPTPETRLTNTPRKKISTKKRRVRLVFEFTSSLEGSRFECAFGRPGFIPCQSPFAKRVKPGSKKAKGYPFKVRAVSDQNVVDPSAAARVIKVRRKSGSG